MSITDRQPARRSHPAATVTTASSNLRVGRGRFRLAAAAMVSAALLLAGAPAPRAADNPAPANTIDTTGDVLTQWQVSAIVSSYPVVREQAGRLAGDDPLKVTVDDGAASPGLTMGAAVATLEGTDAFPATAATVKEYGFASPEDWAVVADRTIAAYRTDRALKAHEDLVAKLDALISRIRVNPQLTADEKARAIDHLTNAEPLLAPQVQNAGDRAAVIPYRADLRRLFAPAS